MSVPESFYSVQESSLLYSIMGMPKAQQWPTFFPGMLMIVIIGAAVYGSFNEKNTGQTILSSGGRRVIWVSALWIAVISLGPYLRWRGEVTDIHLPHFVLYHVIPGFKGIRNMYRFADMSWLVLAPFLGFGVSLLLHHWDKETCRGWFSKLWVRRGWLIMLAVALIEVWPRVGSVAPRKNPFYQPVPPVYQWVTDNRDKLPGAILALPWTARGVKGSDFRTGLDDLFAGYHLAPIVNGHTAYAPHDSIREFESHIFHDDPETLTTYLSLLGVRTVIVSPDQTSWVQPIDIMPWASDHDLVAEVITADSKLISVVPKDRPPEILLELPINLFTLKLRIYGESNIADLLRERSIGLLLSEPESPGENWARLWRSIDGPPKLISVLASFIGPYTSENISADDISELPRQVRGYYTNRLSIEPYLTWGPQSESTFNTYYGLSERDLNRLGIVEDRTFSPDIIYHLPEAVPHTSALHLLISSGYYLTEEETYALEVQYRGNGGQAYSNPNPDYGYPSILKWQRVGGDEIHESEVILHLPLALLEGEMRGESLRVSFPEKPGLYNVNIKPESEFVNEATIMLQIGK